MIDTIGVFITDFGALDANRVKRYFRDDEWFLVEMNIDYIGKGLEWMIAARARRACYRAINVAEAIAEQEYELQEIESRSRSPQREPAKGRPYL